MSGLRTQTASWLVASAALGAGACSADATIRSVQTDGGSSQSGAGGNSGQTATGGASTGGTQPGGAGGAGNGGSAGNSGGTAASGAGGAPTDAGLDGPAPRCNNCWLLDDSVGWEINALFYADGERVVWQEGRDTYDPIATLNVDGTNPQSFTVTSCQVRWVHPTIYGGYVYFNNIRRVPEAFGPGSSCETVFSVDTSVPAPPVAYGYFLDPIGNAFWENIYEHDVRRLVRVDLSNFRVRDESNPNGLVTGAADATSLYGYDNPAAGSGSYRLLRYDRATKATTVMATYVVVPHVLSVDATSLYFESNGDLFNVPKDTTVEVEPTPIPGPDGEWQIEADGTDAVYYKYDDTAFHRMPLAGGAVQTFSTGTFVVRGITWDATRYFVMLSEPNNTTQFRLVRIPK
jgi:hypothetical protein